MYLTGTDRGIMNLAGVADFEVGVRAVFGALLGAWVLWCAITLVVAVFDRRLASHIGPPLLRGLLVAGACAATAMPADAASSRTSGPLDGLLVPDRPTTAVAPPVPAAAPVTSARVVTVRAGDSLWSIVRARLPDAADVEIADAVRRWHAANRDVIGSDPDLIHPGQRLVPPGAA